MHDFAIYGLLLLAALIGWALVFLTHYRFGKELSVKSALRHATSESVVLFVAIYFANEIIAMTYALFARPPYFEVLGVLMIVGPYGYCPFLKNKWRLEGMTKRMWEGPQRPDKPLARSEPDGNK